MSEPVTTVTVGQTLLNWIGLIIGAVASVVTGFVLKEKKELKQKVVQTEQEVESLKQQQKSDHKLLEQKMDSVQNELTEFKEFIRDEFKDAKGTAKTLNENVMKIALNLNINDD